MLERRSRRPTRARRVKPTRTTTRALLQILLLSALLFPARVSAAHPGTPVVVEIDQKAQALIDPHLTRRLVQLELTDVEVPPPPFTNGGGHAPASLYFRVLVTKRGNLRLELWERGEFGGARSVSAARGNAQIRSRRIALAAAELARRLRQKRLYEAQQRLAAKKRAEDEQKAAAAARAPRIALLAGAEGATVGPADAWFAGPMLAGQLRVGPRGRLAVGAAWMAGTVPLAQGAPGARWLELSISPSYAVPLGNGFDLDTGITAAAAAVHLTGMTELDGIENEHDTWSARAVGHFYLESRLSRALALSFGPELGAVLRRVPIVDAAGQRHRLGGLWLGAQLGVVIDPAAPPPR